MTSDEYPDNVHRPVWSNSFLVKKCKWYYLLIYDPLFPFLYQSSLFFLTYGTSVPHYLTPHHAKVLSGQKYYVVFAKALTR